LELSFFSRSLPLNRKPEQVRRYREQERPARFRLFLEFGDFERVAFDLSSQILAG